MTDQEYNDKVAEIKNFAKSMQMQGFDISIIYGNKETHRGGYYNCGTPVSIVKIMSTMISRCAIFSAIIKDAQKLAKEKSCNPQKMYS